MRLACLWDSPHCNALTKAGCKLLVAALREKFPPHFILNQVPCPFSLFSSSLSTLRQPYTHTPSNLTTHRRRYFTTATKQLSHKTFKVSSSSPPHPSSHLYQQRDTVYPTTLPPNMATEGLKDVEVRTSFRIGRCSDGLARSRTLSLELPLYARATAHLARELRGWRGGVCGTPN